MTRDEKYTDMFSKLIYSTAVVTFLKRDGSVRNMLCTRCPETIKLCGEGASANMLNRYDGRCGIENGNLAVVDLVIAEPRQFNIERVLSSQFVGNITSVEQFNKVMEQFKEFSEEYERLHSMNMDMDLESFE